MFFIYVYMFVIHLFSLGLLCVCVFKHVRLLDSCFLFFYFFFIFFLFHFLGFSVLGVYAYACFMRAHAYS